MLLKIHQRYEVKGLLSALAEDDGLDIEEDH